METYLTREKSQYNLNLGTIPNGKNPKAVTLKSGKKDEECGHSCARSWLYCQ